jgi:uncharacterized membrane protein YbhN (UPF0104 family)
MRGATGVESTAERSRVDGSPPQAVSRGSHRMRIAMCATIGVIGAWLATHGVAGVAWGHVAGLIAGVGVGRLVELTVIWLVGLAAYSVVLSAAMPGLGARRGLTVNLTGSAVANAVPLGGALATALNWRMVRGWGHTSDSFVVFAVVTNALSVATKLVLPVLAVVLLSAGSAHVPAVLLLAAGGCLVALAACSTAVVRLMRHPWCPALHGQGNGRWRASLQRFVDGVGREALAPVRANWPSLLAGSVAYAVAQIVLFAFSLYSVGLVAPLPALVAAASIERLGTIVPVTPGGAGVAEVGAIAWLIAAGFDPASAIAGVLLYRTFAFALEIPVGGVVLAVWAWHSTPTRRFGPRGGPACASST